MKTDVDCLVCFLKQTLRVARLTGVSKDRQGVIVKEIASMLQNVDMSKSPPATVEAIYRKIAELTGVEDPYLEQKNQSNELALRMLPRLQQELSDNENALEMAIRIAIAGNIIDYGAFDTVDIDEAFPKCLESNFAVNDLSYLKERLEKIVPGETVLYLTDNCGEIVYDSLLLDYIHRKGGAITIAVKEGPIINDALVEDALFAGLEKYGRIISNGSRCPGTVLEKCSVPFRTFYQDADIVISKGQGNFESLSTASRDIYFLLTVKCTVAARHMEQVTGLRSHSLPGLGEMAVFFSGNKK